MKKIVLLAAALVVVNAASAQTGEITSNRGENWLSQDGDWGLTFDAQPLFHYVGSLFNNRTTSVTETTTGVLTDDMGNPIGTFETSSTTTGQAPSMAMTWANPMFAIQAKKLVNANTAYRGKLRIGFGSNRATRLDSLSVQGAPLPLAPLTGENVIRRNHFDLVLGGGLEKRVGSTRVVGVYGGEMFIMLSNQRDTYEFGEPLSVTNSNGGPGGAGVDTLDWIGQWRTLEDKRGNRFGLGISGFLGVEWFFAPKMSLGAEYMWGLMLRNQGFRERTQERWNNELVTAAGPVTGPRVGLETRTIEGNLTTPDENSLFGPTGQPADRTNQFSLDTGVSGAMITLNFYFQ